MQTSTDLSLPSGAGPVRFLFIEEGSRVFPLSSRTGADDVVVLAGARRDPHDAARRAVTRIESLDRQGRHIVRAEVSVGTPCRPSADARFEARARIALALVRHMARRGFGELVFVAPASSAHGVANELLALVDTLLGQLSSPGVTLRVELAGRA